MNQFGALLLIVGGLAALWTIIRGIQAWQNNNYTYTQQSQWGVFISFFAVTLAVIILLIQLVTSNFMNLYVASYTSEALPLYYKLSALWAGQAGSLLFWLWLITVFSALFIYRHRNDFKEFMPIMTSTFAFVSLLFFGLTILVKSPFETLNFMPQDGSGLNPLLQNWGMAIHPPLLYLGYVGWTVPFGFLVAALITKKLDSNWLKQSRPWTLSAWLFLSLGNLIGAQWAYVELGWGGYWAWDPVENASLMPWLLATAFVHSQIMQERRGIFKFWNVSLLLTTFALTIFGTYLTRSGVLQSVHAFGDTEMGPYFLVFLGIVVLGGIGLIISRRDELASKYEIQTPLSREGTVLFSNMTFAAMTLAVFWGTMYPLTSRIFFGEQRTVDLAFFNDLNVPMGLFVLLLTGVGPLIAWRKASKSNFTRHFLLPISAGVLTAGLLLLFGVTELYPVLTFSLAAFALMGVIQEFYKGTIATKSRSENSWFGAFTDMILNTKRRYGGYLVHIGMIMIFVGIAGSSAYNSEAESKLAPGESLSVDRYTLTYSDFERFQNDLKWSGIAVLDIQKNGKYVGQIRPEKAKFFKSDQPMSEVALRMTLEEDLYVILGGFDNEENIWITARVNPLINWMWLGGLMLIFGTGVALFPDTKKKERQQKAMDDIDAETLIRELSEIEIDYAEGKIDEDVYNEEYKSYTHLDSWIKDAAHARAMKSSGGNGDVKTATMDAIYCHECGTKLPSNAKFCSNCGETQ